MSISEVFYKLCHEYGWTIEYVASLKMKQVITMLKAELSYKEKINLENRKVNNVGNINSRDDIVRSNVLGSVRAKDIK